VTWIQGAGDLEHLQQPTSCGKVKFISYDFLSLHMSQMMSTYLHLTCSFFSLSLPYHFALPTNPL
jgi:hypothetical protein